jgi:cold shock CspA family protein/ribosome-associated translation inhibitor RaiA
MEVPMEIVFRDVERTPEIDRLIEKKVARLDRVCNNLISCRIAIEQPQKHQRQGNPYRVRIEMRIPPKHELVVKNTPGEKPMHEGLHAVITDAFESAERSLLKQMDKLERQTKKHPAQEPTAFIEKLFKDEGYGFIRNLQDGMEYYFHRNSVLHNNFDRLEKGTGVHFAPESGDKGPQASSVEIVDKSSL